MKENPWSNKKKNAGIVIEEKSNRSLKQYGRKAETEKTKMKFQKRILEAVSTKSLEIFVIAFVLWKNRKIYEVDSTFTELAEDVFLKEQK